MTDLKDPPPKTNGINGHPSNSHTTCSTSKASSPNAWSIPGPAAFDFRSDTVTSPTMHILAAIQNCTLFDDVFQEDTTTISLETYIADLTGKEEGLFVISGTMGNQLSVRTHLGGPPHSVLADARSHVIAWYVEPWLDPVDWGIRGINEQMVNREAGGIASVSGAMPIPVTPANSHHITIQDVRKHTILSYDHHFTPTRLICLENTLGGTILPLSDCQQIARWARSQNPPIPLHLDGARLWEAVAANAGSLKEYCACFDSVTMCFSKGLGAPIGSIIVGEKRFVQKARHLRKMMGGGLRQAGVVTAAARVSVEETFVGGRLAATRRRAREVAQMWEAKGGRLARPTETNMVWLNLEAINCSKEKVVEAGVKEGLKLLGGRIVVHYQIADEAIERLGRVMDAILPERKKGTVRGGVSSGAEAMAGEVMAPEME